MTMSALREIFDVALTSEQFQVDEKQILFGFKRKIVLLSLSVEKSFLLWQVTAQRFLFFLWCEIKQIIKLIHTHINYRYTTQPFLKVSSLYVLPWKNTMLDLICIDSSEPRAIWSKQNENTWP